MKINKYLSKKAENNITNVVKEDDTTAVISIQEYDDNGKKVDIVERRINKKDLATQIKMIDSRIAHAETSIINLQSGKADLEALLVDVTAVCTVE